MERPIYVNDEYIDEAKLLKTEQTNVVDLLTRAEGLISSANGDKFIGYKNEILRLRKELDGLYSDKIDMLVNSAIGDAKNSLADEIKRGL